MTTRAARVPGNLPVEVTSFVGRHEVVANLKQALSQSRLVTLTGVGGVGKSRLALHLAHDLKRSYPDGIWLVEFAKLQDPTLVAPAVAASLELHEQSTRDAEAVVVDYLMNKQLLLVMDNCEHLLDACSCMVATLLATAPRLRVLATSRRPLAIPGECVRSVPPLSVPAVDQVTSDAAEGLQSEALTLFEDRAAAKEPSFQITRDNAAAVSQLCRRLDGVQLAIELAAVRLRALSLEQILDRLEDRFRLLNTGSRTALPRHRSLHAAVDWSFDLCTEQEKLAWARCSVFAGGFDLDAAEAVCGDDDLTRDDVFAAVAGLVDKSVLAREQLGTRVRYRLLETIRQYGRQQLDRSGATDTLRRRHRDYYLHLAEQSDAHSWGPDQPEWAARLRKERADLWAALDYCLTTPGQARTGLRMGGVLCFYWTVCGDVREGRRWLTRALSIDTTPSRERARALWVAGWFAFLQGDNAAGRALLEESRDLARRLQDDTDLIYATQFLGDAETFVDNPSRALPLLDEAIAHHRAARSWGFPAVLALAPRARVSFQLGDIDAAVALLTEGQDICRSVGEQWTQSWLALNLGFLLSIIGDTTAAVAQLREALRTKAELHDLLGIPFCVELLACIEAGDDPGKAAALFGGAETMWKQVGRPLFNYEAMLTWSEQAQKQTRDALGDQQFDTDRLRGTRMAQTDVIASALGDEAARGAASTGRASTVDSALLTKRELEIAMLVANGKSNREIATSLFISQRTAESHVQHIFGKLGFTSRAQIAAWVTHQQHPQR
jgi:predicted ATPase/DNA-binding CsgD family transcriptional regulator